MPLRRQRRKRQPHRARPQANRQQRSSRACEWNACLAPCWSPSKMRLQTMRRGCSVAWSTQKACPRTPHASASTGECRAIAMPDTEPSIINIYLWIPFQRSQWSTALQAAAAQLQHNAQGNGKSCVNTSPWCGSFCKSFNSGTHPHTTHTIHTHTYICMYTTYYKIVLCVLRSCSAFLAR